MTDDTDIAEEFSTLGITHIKVKNKTPHPVTLRAPDNDTVQIPISHNGKPVPVRLKFFQWVEHDPQELDIIGFYNKREQLVTVPANFLKKLATTGSVNRNIESPLKSREVPKNNKGLPAPQGFKPLKVKPPQQHHKSSGSHH